MPAGHTDILIHLSIRGLHKHLNNTKGVSGSFHAGIGNEYRSSLATMLSEFSVHILETGVLHLYGWITL